MHCDAQNPFNVSELFELKVFLDVEDGIFDQLCSAGCNQEVVDVDCDYDRCPLLVSFDENALPKTFEVAVRFEVTVLSDILGTTVEGAEKKAEFCKFRGLGEGSETL